jgi:LCP family protein required for cell wall assembly
MSQRLLIPVALVISACLIVPLGGASGTPVSFGRVRDSFQPSRGKIFVLVIGNDARTGNPNARADAVHLAGVNTRTMKGGVLNFPRDSWVPIPGYGSGRINEALVLGGPELLVQTVENLTGIKIDYWVMVGFEGFRGIIRDLNGVPFKITRSIYDPGGSGARLPAGKKHLGAENALAYVRTRKSLPNGDIDRTTNQGRFLLALLRKLNRDVARRPSSLLAWIDTTRRWARFDLSPDDMFRLGILASQVRPRDVENVTVPVTLGSVGGASVVFIQEDARSLYTRFARTGSL